MLVEAKWKRKMWQWNILRIFVQIRTNLFYHYGCTVFTLKLFYLVCKFSGSILVVFGQISIEAHLHQSWQFVPAIRNSISSWILTFVLGAYCSFDRGSKELPIHKIWSNFDFIWYRHTSVKVCPQAAKLRSVAVVFNKI